MTELAGTLPTKDEFASVVNSSFRAVHSGGSTTELLLLKFEDVVANSVQETYTLLFRGPDDATPSQGTYRLEHEKLGSMDIFLVPIKKDAEGLYYEAVFNHFLAAS